MKLTDDLPHFAFGLWNALGHGQLNPDSIFVKELVSLIEDSEKWQIWIKYTKSDTILEGIETRERLKKRIEEKKANLDNFDDNRKTYTLKDIIVSELEELQKIAEGKDETINVRRGYK